MRTAVIIPAYNEADALPGVLAALEAHVPDHDVVVVDDGSTDRTANVARAGGATCLRLPFNLGIGGALRLGFRYAVEQGYDRAYQFDADGQHDASQVSALLAGLQDADMVIGTRFGGDDGYRVGRSRGLAGTAPTHGGPDLWPAVHRHLVGLSGLPPSGTGVLRYRVPGGVHGVSGGPRIGRPPGLRRQGSSRGHARPVGRKGLHPESAIGLPLRPPPDRPPCRRSGPRTTPDGSLVTVETHALLATLTVLAVAVIVRLVRRQVLKAKYTVLWLTVGLVLAITASVPTLLDRVADLLGIWYQPTLFLLLAIGFLLLLSMHFSYEMSRMEKRIRALAEELALLRGPGDDPADHDRSHEEGGPAGEHPGA